MTRLAAAIKAASTDALFVATLESMASSMANEALSLEQHLDELNDYVTLANGLESTVVSVESLSEPTFAHHQRARSQAIGYLKLSGLSDREAVDIFPSLEADNPTSAWEKFKTFLIKLWNFIVEAAKKVFQFIDTVLKKSSLAEKAAMMQLRRLRAEVAARRNALTIAPEIQLRPAHRYLLAPSSQGGIGNLSELGQTIQAFRKSRDLLQLKMPEVIMKVIKDMMTSINKLALGGTEEQVSQSIVANSEAIRMAIQPMLPGGLRVALDVTTDSIPLIYDRVLTINDPGIDAASASQLTSEQLDEYVGQLGLSVDQVQHNSDPENLGKFPALRIAEIEKVLNLAGELIDESHSTDQHRKWSKLKLFSTSLGFDIDNALKVILRKQGLSDEARSTLKLALNARHAMNKWISAPFMQINTVNIRVVESLLAFALDQIKNYEMKDSMQERLDKKQEEEKKAAMSPKQPAQTPQKPQ